MKKSVMVIACMVSFVFLLAVQSASAQADKLIGVWKLTELSTAGPDNETRTIPAGQPYIMIFTKKHSCNVTGGPELRAALPQNATDAQKVAAWEPVEAAVATYEVKGTTVTVHSIVNKNPNVKAGVARILGFKFEGNDLVLIVNPSQNELYMKFTRLE